MSFSNYDISTLIELVEARPCLWDQSTTEYKNRIIKQNAWNEVHSFLVEGFNLMEDKDKNEADKQIKKKWINIREAFMKSIKTKTGEGAKKKYLYHDQLLFLLNTIHADNTESSIEIPLTQPEASVKEITSESHNNDDSEKLQSEKKTESRSKKTKTNAKRGSDIDVEILRCLQEKPDEDEAFFVSLMPAVKKMDDETKLEFRIGVMSLIKSLRAQKLNLRGLSSPESVYYQDFSSTSNLHSPCSSTPHTPHGISEDVEQNMSSSQFQHAASGVNEGDMVSNPKNFTELFSYNFKHM